MKSEEQKRKDREKALQLVKEADKIYFNNDFNRALKLYLEAEGLDHDDPVVLYKIGFSYYKGATDNDNAGKYYNKALKKLKKQDNIKYLAAVYFNLGLIAKLNGESDKKRKYFDLARSLFEKMLEQGQGGGEEYFRLAYYYYDKKDYNNARKYFNPAIKIFKKENPGHFYHAGAYFNIGLTYWEQDDNNSTLYYWKKAVTLDPENIAYQKWYKEALQIKDAK